MRAVSLFIITAALAVPACKKLEPKATVEAKTQQAEVRDKRIRQACASQASYERLKALAFEKADEIREGSSPMLDQLAAASVVRMENPVVKSRDEALNVTVCKGTIVIDLPPGAEDAFNGERKLTAEVEYAAQAAADGSGMIYQLDGAEPIIYRLAAIDMKGAPQIAPTPAAEQENVQVAERPQAPPVILTPPVRPAPREAARPPAREPARTRVAARPATPPVTREAQPVRAAQARPSFNCRAARTRTERMVCGDERLAARDRQMASIYYEAIADSDPETRAILRETRDRFLARRERCNGPGCVIEVYEDRIDEIDRIASGE